MLNKKALAATAAGAEAVYVEDVFSTYLWAGNGSTQTITNGIDLSGEGGMVWMKNRSTTYDNGLFDTLRGVGKGLRSNLTAAEFNLPSTTLTAFNSDGFSIGDNVSFNNSGNNIVGWTFRKAEKFFDVVTYTGNGSNRTISHNLGSVPGCIIVKRTDTSGDWRVYHRSRGATYFLELNSTAAESTGTTIWNDTAPTSTAFTVGVSSSVNASGGTYVAYLFAHDAGGFGDAGDQSVIKCGSYTGNYSTNGPSIDLGWEPQWVLIKESSAAGNRWTVTDNMRGFPVTSAANQQILQPHVSDAEVGVMYIQPTSTGFKVVDVDADVNANGSTYIYIAIRRGPMKTPESGTEVFTPTTYTGNGTSQIESAGFPTDMAIITSRSASGGYERNVGDRLRGGNRTLFTTLNVAENTATNRITAFDNMVGVAVGSDGDVNQSSGSQIAWNFRRAPGFFDVVCYTGNAGTNSQTHNLGVIPDLVICKKRSGSAQSWAVYCQPGGTGTAYNGMSLNDTAASASSAAGSFTSTTFDPQNMFTSGTQRPNSVGENYVAYLFSTLTGVSKVGTYTGTGTTLQINCGFTAGARFVLIKRTDSTGDWYVWDTARGIVSGNDPYLLLNSTDAEVTNTDYIDTYSSGFEISSTAPSAINANGGNFIYLAIA